jgi:hypothetical protein
VKNLAKWQAVKPVSEPINDIFRAMKTLREVDESHSPDVFVKEWGSQITDIVDISHDNPVYDPRGLEKGGIRYHKFPTVSILRMWSLILPISPSSGFQDPTNRVRGSRFHRTDRQNPLRAEDTWFHRRTLSLWLQSHWLFSGLLFEGTMWIFCSCGNFRIRREAAQRYQTCALPGYSFR